MDRLPSLKRRLATSTATNTRRSIHRHTSGTQEHAFHHQAQARHRLRLSHPHACRHGRLWRFQPGQFQGRHGRGHRRHSGATRPHAAIECHFPCDRACPEEHDPGDDTSGVADLYRSKQREPRRIPPDLRRDGLHRQCSDPRLLAGVALERRQVRSERQPHSGTRPQRQHRSGDPILVERRPRCRQCPDQETGRGRADQP